MRSYPTQEQADHNYSLDNQLDKLRAYCALYGHTIVGEYVDPGYSGTTDVRPALARLLQDVEAGLVDLVAVYMLDRLYRTPRLLYNGLHVLESHGVGLASVTQNFDSTTSTGKAMLGMLATFGQFERDTFMERSRDGMRKAVSMGKFTGGVIAFGYRYNPDTKSLYVDTDEADVVRRMYAWAANGLTCHDIAKRLNAMGIPTKYTREGRGIRGKATQNVWRPSRVLNMLKNPGYKGEWEYGRRSKRPQKLLTPGSCPPIAIAELWAKAQAQIASNATFSKRNSKREYLLAGLIKCACGHSYCGSYRARVDGTERLFYRCTTRVVPAQTGPKCANPTIDADFIEGLVWKDLRSFLEQPANVVEALQNLQSAKEPDYTNERECVQKKLDEITEAEARLLSLYTGGVLSRNALDKEAARLEQERHTALAVKAEIERDIVQGEARRAQFEGIQRQLEELSACLEEPTAEQVKQITRTLVRQVLVGTDEDGQPSVSLTYVFGQPTRAIGSYTDTGTAPRRSQALHTAAAGEGPGPLRFRFDAPASAGPRRLSTC